MATFDDLRTYLEHDGWDEEPNLVRGRRRTRDHRRYRKVLADGRVLRTKVSHATRDEIGRSLFTHILHDQLEVTEERFWAVIAGTATLDDEPSAPSTPTVPGWLVLRLIMTAGRSESEVAAMTPDEARAAWDAYRMGEST